MLIMLYDTESKSRNADFNNLRPKGATITLSPSGLSPPERSEHNLSPAGGHNPRGVAPSTL